MLSTVDVCIARGFIDEMDKLGWFFKKPPAKAPAPPQSQSEAIQARIAAMPGKFTAPSEAAQQHRNLESKARITAAKRGTLYPKGWAETVKPFIDESSRLPPKGSAVAPKPKQPGPGGSGAVGGKPKESKRARKRRLKHEQQTPATGG